MEYIRPGEQPDSNDRRGITRFPWKSFFRQWKASFRLNRFWDFLRRLKKGSFGLEKRFCLGLSFIGSIFLEKIHEYIPLGEQPDSSVRRANNRLLSKRFFRPWKAFSSWLELHWTFISRENTWSIFARTNNQIPVLDEGITYYSQKASLGLEKRFNLGLSFIGLIFLEKIHEVPGE